MRPSESPSPESARKRQRLSSPTYDEHFPITEEDMSAFDEIDKQLSQRTPAHTPHLRTFSVGKDIVRSGASGEGVMEDEDRDELIAQEWSSSPRTSDKLSATQERAEEDAFFTEVGTGRGSISAIAPLPEGYYGNAHHSTISGFTSAATLAVPKAHKLRASGSFTLKMPDTSNGSTQPRGDSHQDCKGLTTTMLLSGFGPASALPAPSEDPCDDHPSSPPPPQPDYDSWFDSDASVLPLDALGLKSARKTLEPFVAGEGSASQAAIFASFTSASGLAQAQLGDSAPVNSDSLQSAYGFASAGFSSAAKLNGGKSAWQAPSAEALARAAQMMKDWEDDFVREDASTSVDPAQSTQDLENRHASPSIAPQPVAPSSFHTPLRPALRPMENGTPSPAVLTNTLGSKNPTHYTNIGGGVQMKNKQFKSPLINKQLGHTSASVAQTPSLSTSLHPIRSSSSRSPEVFTFGAASTVPTAVPATPARPAIPMPTVSPNKGKSLGMTPRRLPGGGLKSAGKAKFTTPFKQGMVPGGRTHMNAGVFMQNSLRVDAPNTTKGKSVARKQYTFFDLNSRPDRKTLAASGHRPQSYTEYQLEDMGINVEELREMTPTMAVYYSFHSAGPSDNPAEPLQLGPEAAFAQLRDLGCRIATHQWVTNHYCLILWKLAGMVCLDPESELNPQTKRWCWREVMRQMLYRYERELNGGSRPALRLISTEDAPAACPMVLCVSSIITWAPAVVNSEGLPIEPHPELELTDGWYRLRARVDRPLARAVRRGLIKVGTKLAISGAKLGGDRKEPCEILDAYDKTYLDLSGNSTHLASWHAKLGFVKDPFIATLDSLTSDGGRIPAMDLIVTKTYPIAYVEFIRNEDGSTTKIGPWDEKEELREQDFWLTKRDLAVAKIRANLERQIQTLERLSEDLYSVAGPRFEANVNKDDPIPSYIDGMYDDMLEDAAQSSRAFFDYLNYMDAGFLHIYTLDQIKSSKERLGDDIERELQYECPSRHVRDFRVVVAKDARWYKKEPMRSAQITVWDPLRMVFSEGGSPGDIREGQRFLVANLEVNQPSAWMDRGPESMIYLISKKNARWTNVRSRKC